MAIVQRICNSRVLRCTSDNLAARSSLPQRHCAQEQRLQSLRPPARAGAGRSPGSGTGAEEAAFVKSDKKLSKYYYQSVSLVLYLSLLLY
jgi:hypothetical protein